MRLGVSPAAAQPPRVFSLRGLRLYFLLAGAQGFEVCFAPRRSSQFIFERMWGCGVLPATLPALFSAILSPALSVYLCANVGPQDLLVVRLPSPFVPHSASLSPARASRVLSTLAACLRPPTGLDEYLFFISLVSDFLAVGFSVSSGCARRHSVSTYAAILVLKKLFSCFILYVALLCTITI